MEAPTETADPTSTGGDSTEGPGTLTVSTDTSIVDPAPTSSGSGDDDDWVATLPWITGSTTFTTTGPDGQPTTGTLNEGSGPGDATTTSDGGDQEPTAEPTEGPTDEPSPTTVTSTSTEEGGSEPTDGGDSGSGGDEGGDNNEGGEGDQPPTAAASRVQAVGAGLFAVLAGILAL